MAVRVWLMSSHCVTPACTNHFVWPGLCAASTLGTTPLKRLCAALPHCPPFRFVRAFLRRMVGAEKPGEVSRDPASLPRPQEALASLRASRRGPETSGRAEISTGDPEASRRRLCETFGGLLDARFARPGIPRRMPPGKSSGDVREHQPNRPGRGYRSWSDLWF